jgi:CheY-like chemotaxis protein
MVKVMVVDDNKDLRYLVKENLTKVDPKYTIVEAENGEDCIKKLESSKPDVILMDIMMPGKDGAQTAVEIKENPKTRDIPILFLTAKTDKLSKGMGAIVGEDYIEKPFEPSDLDHRIKAALQ